MVKIGWKFDKMDINVRHVYIIVLKDELSGYSREQIQVYISKFINKELIK